MRCRELHAVKAEFMVGGEFIDVCLLPTLTYCSRWMNQDSDTEDSVKGVAVM